MFNNKWSQWQHVVFVRDDFESTFDILRRENLKTGLIQYKKVLIIKHVKGLAETLSEWIRNFNIVG